MVTHAGSGKSATFGELAAAAAQETPPEEPTLKTPDQFRLIGTSTQRLDSKMKVTGEAIYGLDVSVPGMVVAAIRHAPFGAKIASYDEAAAKAVPGVHDVLEIGQAVYPENSVPCLIVTADTYWQAEKGLKAANPTFDGNGWAGLDSAQIHQAFVEGAEEAGALGRVDGDFDAAIASADKVVEATYEVPYLSHSPLEPMNCLADYRGDSLEIWAATQNPGGGYIMAEKLTGLPQDKINIHVTFVGGGFGRHVEVDYLEQAVEASMKLKKPVKLIWSREEDMQNNFPPPGLHGQDDCRYRCGRQARCLAASERRPWYLAVSLPLLQAEGPVCRFRLPERPARERCRFPRCSGRQGHRLRLRQPAGLLGAEGLSGTHRLPCAASETP